MIYEMINEILENPDYYRGNVYTGMMGKNSGFSKIHNR